MRRRVAYLFLALALLLGGCSVKYSFTGASISPEVKTVSIASFPNVASLVNPTLAATFTEALKEKFVTQTSLSLQNFGGDLEFAGEITTYDVAPVAIQGNETAALNRLTIAVHVKFVNLRDDKANFDRSFSAYEDYSANRPFSDVEGELVATIQEKLVEDIFNAAVANW